MVIIWKIIWFIIVLVIIFISNKIFDMEKLILGMIIYIIENNI